MPFTVTTNNSRVQVLGTTFNVRSRHDNTEVICLTGKVDFGAKEIGKSVVLTGGKRASINGKTLSDVFEVGPDRTIPWMTGELVFHDTPLREVFAELERAFRRFHHRKERPGKFNLHREI